MSKYPAGWMCSVDVCKSDKQGNTKQKCTHNHSTCTSVVCLYEFTDGFPPPLHPPTQKSREWLLILTVQSAHWITLIRFVSLARMSLLPSKREGKRVCVCVYVHACVLNSDMWILTALGYETAALSECFMYLNPAAFPLVDVVEARKSWKDVCAFVCVCAFIVTWT